MLKLSQPGAIVADRFVLEELAGQGGMGTVYRSRDLLLGGEAALKILSSPSGIAPPGGPDVERFFREAELLSSLSHPGIVRHLAHGHLPDGVPFLAMEWLHGEDLADRLRSRRLSLAESLTLLRHVAAALAVAHRRGIVHRDLKPSNLFLRGGQIHGVTLLDFGVARGAMAPALTRTGVLLGTPAYMAPEQVRGRGELSPAVDVFSLGCVLYECLTGRPPFIGEHLEATLVRILFESVPPLASVRPDLPVALGVLLDRMLCKDPAGRLPDAVALGAALDTLLDELGATSLDELPVEGEPPPVGPQRLTTAEQQLCTVLIARAGEVVAGAITLNPGEVAAIERRFGQLHDELRRLGLRTELLADGSLVGALTVDGEHAASDQAERAARCALLIHESWPEATIAVATGRGVLDGQLPIGEAIGRAVHLAHDATGGDSPAGGRILLDAATSGLTHGRFLLAQRPDGAAVLLGPRAAVDETRPLLGRPTPCVGREPELSMLELALGACIEEEMPRALLFLAPPGAGKSRLRHELLRRVAARGDEILVLTGSGEVLGGSAPFGLLRQALWRLCGIRPGDDGELRRRRLHQRVAEVVAPSELDATVAFLGELSGVPFPDIADAGLMAARSQPRLMEEGIRRAFLSWLGAECRRQPVLLVLDDLQWGDAATVQLIDAALRTLDESALFVLGFSRPEVTDLFPRLWPERVQLVTLRPLSRRACEQLIHQVLGEGPTAATTARIVEQAAGNALYLEELIRLAAEGKEGELPATVILMMQSRVSRLDPGARRTLRAASVFGDTCYAGGVAALLGCDRAEAEGRLDALVTAELLERRLDSRFSDEIEYRFRHALMREAAYSLLAEHDRRLGHRLAAAFLEEVGEGAAALAYHFEAAGEFDKALFCYVGASNDAARLDLLSEERRHYEGALRMLGSVPDEPMFRQIHIDLLLKQVDSGLTDDPVELQLGRLHTARTLVEGLSAGTSPTLEQRLSLAQIDYGWGRVLHYASQPAAAIRHYLRAMPVAEEANDRDLLLLSRFGIGAALCLQGAFATARVTLEQVLDPIEARGDRIEWLRCLLHYGISLAASGWIDEALRATARSRHPLEQSSQPSARMRVALLRGLLAMVSGDAAAALGEAETALELGRLYPASFYRYLSWDLVAWAEGRLGRPQALDSRLRAREIRQPVGGGILRDWFEAVEAELLLEAGQTEEALVRAQRVAIASHADELRYSEVLARRIWGLALGRLGAPLHEAEAQLTKALALAAAHAQAIAAAEIELTWGQLLDEHGERAEARRRFERAITDLDQAGAVAAAATARRIAR